MDTEREDHDQRLKVLLKEFFVQFLKCFFPEWAERFDFTEIEFLDKETFLSPPTGEKRYLDLLARVRIRADAPPPFPGCDSLVVLIHVEVDSGDSIQQLRPRMFEYYVQIRRDHQLPVFPIGLFLRVGLDGVGWDCYEERFWERVLLRYEYAYVGLPALDAEKYLNGEYLLGAALSSLMRVPADRRAELHLEALKRIAVSGENDFRRYLLAECLETYAKLDEEDRRQLTALLESKSYLEVRPLMITTYERGKMDGKLEGKLEERRENLLVLLEAKFGILPPEVAQRVATLDPERLRRLSVDMLKSDSLKELNLQD